MPNRAPAPPLPPNALLRWDVVSRLLPRGGEIDMLEIGCGKGATGVRLANRYRSYLGLEIDRQSFQTSSERLAALGGHARVCHGTTRALPDEQRFDLVCAFEVLEHIADDTAALADWVSRLRPGGTLLLSVPAFQHRYAAFDRLVGHIRRYEPEQLHTLLSQAGLTDVVVLRYGAPLGYLLEAGRNLIGTRIERRTPARTLDQRTTASGRLLQPGNQAVGLAAAVTVAPFRLLQRAFPNRGVGVIARGMRPTSPTHTLDH